MGEKDNKGSEIIYKQTKGASSIQENMLQMCGEWLIAIVESDEPLVLVAEIPNTD